MKKLCRAAAILAAVLVGCDAAHAAPKPKPKPPTAAELHRVQSQRLVIYFWKRCVRDTITFQQTAYLEALTEHDAQRYLSALGEPDAAECKLQWVNWCEGEYPGECIAAPGEVNGRRP